jgi:hypothetical protein
VKKASVMVNMSVGMRKHAVCFSQVCQFSGLADIERRVGGQEGGSGTYKR